MSLILYYKNTNSKIKDINVIILAPEIIHNIENYR